MQKEKAEAIAVITKDQAYQLMMDVEIFNELDNVETFDDAIILLGKAPKGTEIEKLAFSKLMTTGKEQLLLIDDFSTALSFFNNTRHLGELELWAIERLFSLSKELFQYHAVHSITPDNHYLKEHAMIMIERVGREKLSEVNTADETLEILKHALPGSRFRAETLLKLAEFV